VFLCSLCRYIITGTVWGNQSVARMLSWKSSLKRRLYVCCSYSDIWKRVIQWICYSYCVKICCQEMASGDCKKLRTLVWVWQESVKYTYESWVYKWPINSTSNPKPRLESLIHVAIYKNIVINNTLPQQYIYCTVLCPCGTNRTSFGVNLLLTPTCHASWCPWQVINAIV
jgi:hypothetical protein